MQVHGICLLLQGFRPAAEGIELFNAYHKTSVSDKH
jgi:hypothetical protein